MIFQKKQINNNKVGQMIVSNFVASGSSDDITAALATAASNDNVDVIASNGDGDSLGFLVTNPLNKVKLIDAVTKTLIGDDSLDEIYGRITESAGIYTISYYSLVGGVEAPASVNRNIDLFPEYNFAFKDFPYDSNLRIFDRINNITPATISSASFTTSSTINQLFDIVEIDATNSNIVITLGDIVANSISKNKRMTLKRIDESLNTVTINGTASNYEDEGLDLSVLEGVTIYASNSNIWRSID